MKVNGLLYLGIVALGLRALGCSSDSSIEGNDLWTPRSAGGGETSSGGSGGKPSFHGGFPGAPKDFGQTGPTVTCVPGSTLAYTMSADDSNSMGSPGYAREMLDAHKAPDPSLIRTYEFLNYYDMHYAPAPAGSLSVIPQVVANPAVSGEYRLQIGVRAPAAASSRRPMSLTLVADTSQSMAGEGLRNAKAVVRQIVASLLPGDRVSLITLDSDVEPILDGQEVSSDSDKLAIQDKAASLHLSGGHDLQGGLVRGYSLAYQHYDEDDINRVVLITDGRVNPASIDRGFIDENAKSGDEKGIYLVGVGTGPAEGYNDALLNQLTDVGRGAYVYVDTEAEAERLFGEHFSEIMDVAARDVSVTLTLPDYVLIGQYYGEAISSDVTSLAPQHLGGDDTMVFTMLLHSCDPDLLLASDVIRVDVRWQTPWTREQKTLGVSATLDSLLQPQSAPAIKANAVIAFAEALKSLDKQRLEEAYCAVKGAYAAIFPIDSELEVIRKQLLNHPLLLSEPVCLP